MSAADQHDFSVGIVGLGNMGGAIARGLVRSSAVGPTMLHGFDPAPERAEGLSLISMESAADVAASSSVVIIAVKPAYVEEVLAEVVTARPSLVISVAAGVSLEALRRVAGESPVHLVRAMPNTAASARASITALCAERSASSRSRAITVALFSAVGDVVWVDDESQMHAATAIVGSGPAFVYLLAEALADGAVAEGLPRQIAARAVAGMMRSAAVMLADGGSPAELKDAVASPGGTTIAGIRALERLGLRSAAFEAVVAASARSRELSG